MSLHICRENINQFFLHTMSFSFFPQILYQSIFHPNPPLRAPRSRCDENQTNQKREKANKECTDDMILNHFMVNWYDRCRITHIIIKMSVYFPCFSNSKYWWCLLKHSLLLLVQNSHCLWYAHEKSCNLLRRSALFGRKNTYFLSK